MTKEQKKVGIISAIVVALILIVANVDTDKDRANKARMKQIKTDISHELQGLRQDLRGY